MTKIICCSVYRTNVLYAIINPEITLYRQIHKQTDTHTDRHTDTRTDRRQKKGDSHTDDGPSTDLLSITITAL